MVKIVLDKNMLEAIPVAYSEPPDSPEKTAMLYITGTYHAVEFLRSIKGTTVMLPACWRSDLLVTDSIMAPIDFEDDEFDFSDVTMDAMVNDFLDAHEQISSYLDIQEAGFSPKMVERLKELYFYLPVEYFSPDMLTTYQYAAFAWGLGLPFYTRNAAFFAAIHPQIRGWISVLTEPAPERRLVLQTGSQPEDLEKKLAWIHLLADTDKERAAYELTERIQR